MKSAIVQLGASSAPGPPARRGSAVTGRGRPGPRCVVVAFRLLRCRLAACREGLRRALTRFPSRGAGGRSGGSAEICYRLLGGRWRWRGWKGTRGTCQGSRM